MSCVPSAVNGLTQKQTKLIYFAEQICRQDSLINTSLTKQCKIALYNYLKGSPQAQALTNSNQLYPGWLKEYHEHQFFEHLRALCIYKFVDLAQPHTCCWEAGRKPESLKQTKQRENVTFHTAHDEWLRCSFISLENLKNMTTWRSCWNAATCTTLPWPIVCQNTKNIIWYLNSRNWYCDNKYAPFWEDY